jgi:glycine/D-amino acid oxidase-like deaminating enzyme
MSQTHIDTLILGQGLAGSLLAWMLIRSGLRVCVLDDGHKSSSSTVAAGLINPLAGMRFNRRPEMDDWLRASDRCYAVLATQFGSTFFHPLPMLRLFRSPGQRRFHARRLDDPASHDLLAASFEAGGCPEPVVTPYGGFTQHRTGYVDMPLLLANLRAWLQDNDSLLEHELACDQIDVSDGGVAVPGIEAQRLVFCDGARLRSNPWFSGLPLAPDKGEILNLQIDGWRPRHIINGAHWLVPLANAELRLGATHEHHRLDNQPTPTGKQELLAGLDAILPSNFETRVVQHQAGIRPATRDRYPLLGRHPEQSRLWVFNGFGARGALTIPWYAERMSAHLVDGAPLPQEADIRRFA